MMRTLFPKKVLKQITLAVAGAIVFLVLGDLQISAQKLPPVTVTQALLRQTLLDFADAVEAEDFTSLYEKSSADFQASFTPENLKTAFQSFIDKKALVLPSLRTIRGKRSRFSRGPLIRTEKGYKILVADGSFPTVPYKTNFQMEYEWTEGAWKLLVIKVKM